jgi:predicted pyridoxine 5'-phosphate oxidase superfamily flavin-nucleotide-binding protein
MTTNRPPIPPGFHEGELAVQEQAGVRAEVSRLTGMLGRADLGGGAARFLSGQRYAVLSGRDRRGRLWVSPLSGPAGFLEVTDANTLRVHSRPSPGDPLNDLPAGQHVGLLAIDFNKRRRYRINGWLAGTTGAALTIEADQAFGNCPQYIRQRDVTTVGEVATDPRRRRAEDPSERTRLTAADRAHIGAADTFFLGTAHPDRGGDASHRGGPAGFVRVDDDRHLWWPDYPGNNMFNSFGNLAVDPTAALLFCDFDTGRTLHLAGRAQLQRTAPGSSGDDGGTGRRVAFTVEHRLIRGPAPGLGGGRGSSP